MTLAGLALDGIPAGSAAHPLVRLLAVLLAVGVAFGGFAGLLAIAACMRSSQITREEERSCDLAIALRLSATEPTAPPVSFGVPVTPQAPVLLTNAPFTIGNPITSKLISPEIRQ